MRHKDDSAGNHYPTAFAVNFETVSHHYPGQV
jgi:hypothetical protein